MASGHDGRQGTLGRGFLFITGAKVYFMATATVASLLFPRLFGDPVAFGRFRVVSGALNVVTMVVVTATVQAASRLASEAGADLASVRSSGLRVQAALFGSVFVVSFVLAGPIAAALLDPALEAPLRVASLVVAAYAWYALLIGILNGTRRFGTQAALDATFSTLKTAGMIVAVALTSSPTWAFGAFAAAAVTVLAAAMVLTPDPPPGLGGTRATPRRFASYLLPLAGYALVLNLLLQADVVAVKAGLGAAGPDASSAAAGVYGAARNAALLPYQVVIALTFVVFPVVSRSVSEGNSASAAASAAGALRLAAILSFGSIAALGAAPQELLGLLFGPEYARASCVLVPLLAASACTAMMYVGNAILASAGHPAASLVGATAGVAVQFGGLLALPLDEVGAALVSAASATLAGSAVGAAATLVLVRRVAPGAAWSRTLLASAAAAAFSVALADALTGMVPWPVLCLAAVLAFALGVILLRGVVRADMDRVRAAFGLGGSRPRP